MTTVDDLFLEAVRTGILKQANYAKLMGTLKRTGRSSRRLGAKGAKKSGKMIGELGLWSVGAGLGGAAYSAARRKRSASDSMQKQAAIGALASRGLRAGLVMGRKKMRTLSNKAASAAAMGAAKNSSKAAKLARGAAGPLASGAAMGVAFEALTPKGGTLDDNPGLRRG